MKTPEKSAGNSVYSSPFLAAVLVSAIFFGLLLAWPKGYWGIAGGICALATAGVVWSLTPGTGTFDWRYIPVAAIGIWPIAQKLLHVTVEPAMTDRAAIVWGMCAVAFVLASQILQSRRGRDRFLKWALGASVVLATLAIIQKFAFATQVFGIFEAEPSVFGTFFYENQFAGFMEIAAPMALWRIFRGDTVYGGVCYAILFGATVVSGSRAGVALVLAELLVFLIAALGARKFSVVPAVGMILLFTAVAALVVGTDRMMQRLENTVPETVRLDLSKSTLQMIRERPWTGYGMGAWRPVYPRFATFDLALIANEAHDDWAQWAAEGGIPFALLMAILAISLVKPAVGSIWGLGLPIVLVHSSVDYVLREPALAFLWFALGGMLCHVSGGQEQERFSPSEHRRNIV